MSQLDVTQSFNVGNSGSVVKYAGKLYTMDYYHPQMGYRLWPILKCGVRSGEPVWASPLKVELKCS